MVATLAAGVTVLTGCRATMPKWNLFGSRRAPSAEMLAGDGPTTTYPAPPGESATPMAIASTAGGTSGVPASPGTSGNEAFAAIAKANGLGGPTNPAAARANGFGVPSGINLASNRSTTGGSATPAYAASSRTSPSSRSTGNGFDLPGKNSSVPSIPAGYQFGTRETPPSSFAGSKPQGVTLPGPESTVSATSPYKIPSSYPAPGSTPSFAMPDSEVAKSAATTPSTGFTMPGATPPAAPTQSAPFEPKPSTAAASIGMPYPPVGVTDSSSNGNATPARIAASSGEPAFSTASAELTPRSTLSNSPNLTSEGYAPGSTNTSAGYPTTSGFPSTGTDNSFYR
ncbi:MAG: hypothetical protein AAF802_12360 [Planctomycetota bacterium]